MWEVRRAFENVIDADVPTDFHHGLMSMSDQDARTPDSAATSPQREQSARPTAESQSGAAPAADHAEAAPGEDATAAARDEGTAAARDEGTGTAQEPDLQARISELEDLRLRALADLDNYRKRVDSTMARVVAEERAQGASEWLPVLDNLDRALSHADPDTDDPLIQGIRAVRDQAVAVIARLGFPRQDQVGVPFDPVHHEAVSTVNDRENPEGTVVEIIRPGYGDDRRQLRPASVVVATRDD
jgi:molecular chaperone GrpE